MLDGFLRLTPCPVCSGLDLPAELIGAAAAPRCPACGEEFVERPVAGRVVVSVGRAGQRRSVGEPAGSR
ncbi:MAG: hypothetical protein QOG45_2352 [Chloroflexota bacterium]|nr:hypothetical protein [Chloroflexota bacterium]